MQIQGTETITHPAQLVFETLRDKTPQLVEILPNIDGVEVLEREETPPVVRLYNRWQGSQEDIPKVLRPFVKKELLYWHDRASWDQNQLQCTWQIESMIGKEIFSCQGTTTITPQGEGYALFTLQGELRVDPTKVPGVPKFLARKLQEPLEKFIAKALSPNLTNMAHAVQKYLDGRG